jgi:membrane-bound metal-dependent hydrolase YbcI (DUF457 family)
VFVGHLAAGFAATRFDRRLPLSAAVAAAFGLDLLWPLLLLLGLETVRVNPGDTAFTPLTFVSYPWSHSLAMVIVWSVLAALAARRAWPGSRAATLVGALVASHWLLDFLTHRPDLPLWPDGPVAGLGLWNSIAATLLVEGALLAVGIWVYHHARPARDRTGNLVLAGLVLLSVVIWGSQPWSPPPPTASAVAWGALALWLLPPWAAWIERYRR